MAGGIELDSDRLRYHAGRVQQNADDIRLAQDAASSLNLGGGAFGVMCSMLVPPATLVSSVAISTIAAAAELVEKSARDLKSLADDVDGVEHDNSAQITDIRAAMGGQ